MATKTFLEQKDRSIYVASAGVITLALIALVFFFLPWGQGGLTGWNAFRQNLANLHLAERVYTYRAPGVDFNPAMPEFHFIGGVMALGFILGPLAVLPSLASLPLKRGWILVTAVLSGMAAISLGGFVLFATLAVNLGVLETGIGFTPEYISLLRSAPAMSIYFWICLGCLVLIFAGSLAVLVRSPRDHRKNRN